MILSLSEESASQNIIGLEGELIWVFLFNCLTSFWRQGDSSGVSCSQINELQYSCHNVQFSQSGSIKLGGISYPRK